MISVDTIYQRVLALANKEQRGYISPVKFNLYAKRQPRLFLELANDENVVLRNFGIRATEMKILKLSSDQRNFLWGSNDRKIMTVPFDEHPYTALAHWFKTDEGMEIYANIEKRLK